MPRPYYMRRHTRIHWLWTLFNDQGRPASILLTDDFGNLVNMRPGLHSGLLAMED